MTRRVEFSRKVRREALARAAGKCQKCEAILKVGVGACEIDHILPSELGGQATLANAMVLCVQCHKAKTAADIGRIRKADRQGDKASGVVKPKGFSKAPKPPKPSKFDMTQRRSLFAKETAP